jgi:demethylmenaquinone methyltransferase / 2-methoxy-6-polyprenyl-1,4-benzoquinol methylase
VPFLPAWPRGAVERAAYADRIFGSIACRYDLFTRLLSFGQDARWKRLAAGAAVEGRTGRILDLATGTGAIPEALRRHGHSGSIVALDRSDPMLARGGRRLASARALLVRGDVSRVPFRCGSFDAITLGYGLRYCSDLKAALRALHALLRPGGVLVSLDFGLPRSAAYRTLCFAYLLGAGTAWGVLLHGRASTYHHIVESLRAYPGQGAVARDFVEAGFVEVTRRGLMGGIAAPLTGRRPTGSDPP